MKKKNPDILAARRRIGVHHCLKLESKIRTWRDTKRIPQSVLLTGPEGIGKGAAAFELAKTFQCSGDSRPCGSCSSCLRYESGHSIDLTVLSPGIDGTTSTSLSIEQIRELQAKQGHGAFEGPFFIVIIEDAHTMTVQAANALLKILEEPPRTWVFILTAPDPGVMLPTVLSRCIERARLDPIPNQLLLELLGTMDVPENRCAEVAKTAGGSFGRALLLASEETWSEKERLVRLLGGKKSELSALVDWAGTESSRLGLLLDWLELEACERLKAGNKGTLKSLENIERARSRLALPLNRKLLAQEVLGPWILRDLAP